jgi:hypothetical protein
VRSGWVILAIACAACEPRSHAAPTTTKPPTVAAAPNELDQPPVPFAIPGGDVLDAAPPPKAKPVRRPGAYADLDPDNDLVVDPPDVIPDCEEQLKAAGIKFAPATLAIHEAGPAKHRFKCGAPQVVTYLKGPGNIAYNGAPLLTCGMALALASFEKLLQEEATNILKSQVVRIDHIGTYNCRFMPAYPDMVSEHSYANAIDIGDFVLKDGRTISVLDHFDASETDDPPPKTPAARWLRVVSRRANDEDVFSHVLTPYWDALHKNHFHLDLARYRNDGTRPHG